MIYYPPYLKMTKKNSHNYFQILKLSDTPTITPNLLLIGSNPHVMLGDVVINGCLYLIGFSIIVLVFISLYLSLNFILSSVG